MACFEERVNLDAAMNLIDGNLTETFVAGRALLIRSYFLHTDTAADEPYR